MFDFIKYVKSFYSKNGGLYGYECNWTDEQIEEACKIKMRMPDYVGDTFDREWVRDHLLGYHDNI